MIYSHGINSKDSIPILLRGCINSGQESQLNSWSSSPGMNILDREKINNIARTLPSIANAKRILKSFANGSKFSQSCSNGPPAIGY